MIDPGDYDNIRWRDASGKVWTLQEMTDSHLQNCLCYLRRTAADRLEFEADAGWQALSMLQGEMASMMVENEVFELECHKVDPVRWARKQDGYVAIVLELWRRRCVRVQRYRQARVVREARIRSVSLTPDGPQPEFDILR